MKKRLNLYKIGALVMLLVEIGIAMCLDQKLVKENLLIWRVYVACIMFIPINVMFICSKRRVVKK